MDIETVLSVMPVLAAPLLPEYEPTPVSQLSNEAVLMWADRRMDPIQFDRLAELHRLQKERPLSAAERDEVDVLMGIYETGQLRKAEAMVEAIRRGLRERGPA